MLVLHSKVVCSTEKTRLPPMWPDCGVTGETESTVASEKIVINLKPEFDVKHKQRDRDEVAVEVIQKPILGCGG